MNYKVRKLILDDIDSVISLSKKFTEDEYPFQYWELDEKDVRFLLETSERDVFVVEVDEQIVGIGSVTYEEGSGYLSAGIDRDHRRKGVAALLLEELMNAAKGRQCCKLVGEVWEKNIPSQKLALSLGFTNTDKETVVHQNRAFGEMINLVFRKDIIA